MAGERSRANGRKGGRPKGRQNAATMAASEQKAIAREAIREHVQQHIPAIVQSLIENACGQSVLVLQSPDGTYSAAKDESQVAATLAAGGRTLRAYTRPPHQPSAALLLAYVADKPVEPVEMTGAEGGPVKVSIAWHLPPSPETSRRCRPRTSRLVAY
jgi:hypothetical protein